MILSLWSLMVKGKNKTPQWWFCSVDLRTGEEKQKTVKEKKNKSLDFDSPDSEVSQLRTWKEENVRGQWLNQHWLTDHIYSLPSLLHPWNITEWSWVTWPRPTQGGVCVVNVRSSILTTSSVTVLVRTFSCGRRLTLATCRSFSFCSPSRSCLWKGCLRVCRVSVWPRNYSWVIYI